MEVNAYHHGRGPVVDLATIAELMGWLSHPRSDGSAGSECCEELQDSIGHLREFS
jgi:hypothetical protein